MSDAALELRGVTKSYADRVALDDISVGVERGELVALIGANGAGKSTLLQLAVGLLDPTSGAVLVEGAAAGSLEARRSLSYISDQPSLYDDLTVNEHIEYVSRLHGGPARPESADELLDLLNLSPRADDLPARFSRGLRQKTAIVLALVRPFSVLLVDEPFVGLDPAGQDALAELLTAAADAGCAVMVATHQLAFLERVTRCVALRDGAVAYRGPVDRAVIDPLLDAMPGLLLLSVKCVRVADEPGWDAWEDDVHVPALCGPDRAWAATRFELTARPAPGMPGIGFTHVTISELDDDDVSAQAARILAVDDDLRATGRMHPAHAPIAADAFVAHGAHGHKPAPSAARTGHILSHVLCTDPGRVVEWDRWYDEQHVPDMLSCGAFSAMSRWRRVEPRAVGPNHLTLYDVSTPTIDEAVARSAATLADVVATGRKHECHAGALTVTLRPAGRHGGAGYRRIA